MNDNLKPRAWWKRLKYWKFALEILTLIGLFAYVGETNRTNDLTAAALRLQNGAKIRANYQMGWYDLGQPGKTPNAIIVTQNDSLMPAESVELTARLEFRKYAPAPDADNFSLGDHQAVTSQGDALRPSPIGVIFPVSPQFDNKGYSRIYVTNPDKYSAYLAGKLDLYAWGTITFSDSLSRTLKNSPAPATFCRFVTAGDVRVADSDLADGKWGGGYKGHYNSCPHP